MLKDFEHSCKENCSVYTPFGKLDLGRYVFYILCVLLGIIVNVLGFWWKNVF